MTNPLDAATYAAKLRELRDWARERAKAPGNVSIHPLYIAGRSFAFREIAQRISQELGSENDEPA